MLKQENLQQTVCLILLKAFADSEPALTALFQRLYRDCPSLFDFILPQLKKKMLMKNDESQLSILEDTNHIRLAAIGCLQPKYCCEILELPTRSSAMSAGFRGALWKAYNEDYQMPNIHHFSHTAIKWCRKLSFTDRYILLQLHWVSYLSTNICVLS